MVMPEIGPTHSDPTTKTFEGAAKLAERIFSFEDAEAYFAGEGGADIDCEIAKFAQQKRNFLRRGLTLEAAQNMARDGCANALWQAVLRRKQSVLDKAMLRQQPTPPYTREMFEADMRALGEDPAFLKFDTMFQRRQNVDHGNKKQFTSDADETPTIGTRLSSLSESMKEAREQVAGIVMELEKLFRVNLLNAPIARNSREPAHENIFKLEIHTTIHKCRTACAALDDFARLTDRLSQNRDVGRKPDLFRAAFVAAMIPVWEQLTGLPPKRENQRLLDLLSIGYACFAHDGFEGWDAVLRTELSKLPKRPTRRSPKAKPV